MSQIEIERRFLCNPVKAKWALVGCQPTEIAQYYIHLDGTSPLRVRICDGRQAFLTHKSASLHGAGSFSRVEKEIEVDIKTANYLIDIAPTKGLFGPPVIYKTRYEKTDNNGMIWEVDFFHGFDKEIIIAEIELNDEKQSFDVPDFVTQEITQYSSLSNYSLAKFGIPTGYNNLIYTYQE